MFFEKETVTKNLLPVLATLIVLANPILAQELPQINEIMNIAIQKVFDDNKLKSEKFAFYNKRYSEEDLGDLGGRIVPKNRKEELYKVFVKNGVFFEELIAQNGKGVQIKNNSSPKLADKRPDIEDILGKNRYNYKLDGLSEFNGEMVYSIILEPRHPSLQPFVTGSMEKEITNDILNNLHGLVYISQESHSILRVEVHLNKPPLRIKTIGLVNRFDAIYEQQEIEGISVGKRLTLITKYSKLSIVWNFFESFQRITVNYEDYTPIN